MTTTPDLTTLFRVRVADELASLRRALADDTDAVLVREESHDLRHSDRPMPDYTMSPWPEEWPITGELTVAHGLNLAEREAEAIATTMTAEVEAAVDAVVAPELRVAVLARSADLAKRWEWPIGLLGEPGTVLHALVFAAAPPRSFFDLVADEKGDVDMAATVLAMGPARLRAWIEDRQHRPGALPYGSHWPAEAALLDVARWAQAALNRLSQGVNLYGDDWVRQASAGEGRVTMASWTIRPVGRDGPRRRLPASGVALVYLAEKEVRQSALVPVVRMSATRAGRAALAVLAAGPPHPEDSYPYDETRSATNAHEGWVELVWNGRPRPIQLTLRIDDRPELSGGVLRGILEELHEDGVRDWLVLHRMAGEQGASGHLLWTWAEHRERTAYIKRLRAKHVTDENLAEAVTHRLWRLKHTELRWYERIGSGAFEWRRIGPFGLLDIPAGREMLTDAGRSLRTAVVDLNPAIYEGARRGAPHPHFALLPEAALVLPGPELRLIALTFYDFTYQHEAEGVVKLKASTLWDYAKVREGRPERRRWPAATTTLERQLDRAGKAVGWNWERDGEPGPEAVYTLTRPEWWADRVLRGVSPTYGASTAGLPRTWGELREWRKRNGISQAAAGELLGVRREAVSRGEHAAEAPLPPELVTRLAKNVRER